MAERASVFQNVVLGVEVTPGTAVTPTVRLRNTFLRPRVVAPVDMHRPGGGKFNTDATAQKEHTECEISGIGSYCDLAYLFNSLLVKPGSGGTWTFLPSGESPDAFQTYTVQYGSALRAEQFAYAFVSALDLNFTRTGVSLGGTMIGRTLQETATYASGLTDVKKVPISPKSIDIYVASTVAGLSAGKITRAMSLSTSFRNMRAPMFSFDSTQDSFAAPVDTAADFGATLVLQHDSVGAGYMANLRNTDTRYLRVKATGPSFGAGSYALQITFPFKFQSPTPTETEGVDALSYPLGLIDDGVGTGNLAGAVEVVLTTDVATLG